MTGGKCHLCKSQDQTGGSIASDNVVRVVTCDTFSQMDKLFTNEMVGGSGEQDIESIKVYNSQLAGAKKRTSKKKSTGAKKGSRSQKGGSSCDVQIVNDLPSTYSVNPANIPLTVADGNTGALDMSRISQYVFDGVAQQSAINNSVFNKVYFPEYISEHLPDLQQSGGKKKQRGGCAPCSLLPI